MVLGKESPTYNLPLPCKFFSIGAARSSLQIKMITNIEILFMTKFEFFCAKPTIIFSNNWNNLAVRPTFDD